jgi:metallo-beta-lactamase class B
MGTFALQTAAQERPTAPQADLSKAIRDAKMVEPFKVFDNLYYVGMDWVSAWLIPTSEGLILIDALYGEFTEPMIANIRKLGFDPAKIRYCFATHGHFDHAAGLKQVKDVAQDMRIGMIEADWDMYINHKGGGKYDVAPQDRVMKDGDTTTLGDTTLRFYATPGHTLGVPSIAFTVLDGGAPHSAFVLGGAGLNFAGVPQSEMFVSSMERVKALPGIEVNVPNHPAMGTVFEREEKLKARKPGEPHPFVDSAAFYKWIDQLSYGAGPREVNCPQMTQILADEFLAPSVDG